MKHAVLGPGLVDPNAAWPDLRTLFIVVIDQWKRKPQISARSIYPRGSQLRIEGNAMDDSDNAEHFYVVR